MNLAQIILSVLLAFLGVLWVRRALLRRSIRHYRPSEVAGRVTPPRECVLLDVRTDAEFRDQHIKGALHIPVQTLAQRIDELARYRDREIICYCRTGNRSMAAAAQLKKAGFTVANMKGGILEWDFSQHRQ